MTNTTENHTVRNAFAGFISGATIAGALVYGIPAMTSHNTTTGTSAPAYVSCQEEDGSTPGQVFPCAWDGGSNKLGNTYVLTAPSN